MCQGAAAPDCQGLACEGKDDLSHAVGLDKIQSGREQCSPAALDLRLFNVLIFESVEGVVEFHFFHPHVDVI